MGAFGDPRVPDMKHAADILLGARFRARPLRELPPGALSRRPAVPDQGLRGEGRRLRGLPREHGGLLRGRGRPPEKRHARRGRGPGRRLHAQGGRAHPAGRLRVRARPGPQARRHVGQVQRHAVRRRPLAAELRRRGPGVSRDRGLAPLHRRALHADGQGSPPVRGHRDQQHVRRHRDRSRRGAAGRARDGGLGQHPPRPRLDVRAGARVGAQVRGHGPGQSLRRDPDGGTASGSPGPNRRGGGDRGGGRGVRAGGRGDRGRGRIPVDVSGRRRRPPASASSTGGPLPDPRRPDTIESEGDSR